MRKPIWVHNELWPLTFDLRTPNSNLTCILVSSTNTSKIFKILPTFWSYCAETKLNIWAVTFDLWPADSEFELDLYFTVIYLHIKNIQNPSIIFEVIVRKPIWIYNELWPLTFDLRTPNSNLTCISVSSTYTSKIFKIRPTCLKLLCGNQFEYIMSFDLWPADSEFELDLYFGVIYLYIENIQNPSKIFEVIVREPIRGTDGRTDRRTEGRTDGQVQCIMPPPDFVCGGIKIWCYRVLWNEELAVYMPLKNKLLVIMLLLSLYLFLFRIYMPVTGLGTVCD